MPISSSGFSSDSPCIDEHWDDDAGRGVTRLILAARTGTLSEVCSLCDAGANVNYAPEWDGWDFGGKQYASPLIVAANRGDVDIVRTLLQRGANANFIMCDTDPRSNDDWHTEGWTALMSAVSSTCLEVVELIVAAGADVSASAVRSQWVDRLETFEERETVTALSLARTLKLDAIAGFLGVGRPSDASDKARRQRAQASTMADLDQPLVVQAVLESEERPRPRGKRPREGEEGESSAGKPPLRWCARTRSFI